MKVPTPSPEGGEAKSKKAKKKSSKKSDQSAIEIHNLLFSPASIASPNENKSNKDFPSFAPSWAFTDAAYNHANGMRYKGWSPATIMLEKQDPPVDCTLPTMAQPLITMVAALGAHPMAHAPLHKDLTLCTTRTGDWTWRGQWRGQWAAGYRVGIKVMPGTRLGLRLCDCYFDLSCQQQGLERDMYYDGSYVASEFKDSVLVSMTVYYPDGTEAIHHNNNGKFIEEFSGVIKYPDGRVFEGVWSLHHVSGHICLPMERRPAEGKMTYPDGRVVQGRFDDNNTGVIKEYRY